MMFQNSKAWKHFETQIPLIEISKNWKRSKTWRPLLFKNSKTQNM